MNVITVNTPEPLTGVYRYVRQPEGSFDEVCFDAQALQNRGLLDGLAMAGRGNTTFFTLQDEKLVLRHYYRGGFAQRISTNQYLYTGMPRTRAFREFDMLLHLQQLGLPAPRPYACRVLRHGLFYTACLVTHRLPGHTLAQTIQSGQALNVDNTDAMNIWQNVGETIAKIHSASIYHADLNAHNIMLDDNGRVALIDFDRSTTRVLPEKPASSGWCLANIDRLERSIKKIVASLSSTSTTENLMDGFALCKQRWMQSISK